MPRTIRLKSLDEIARSKIVVLRRKLGLQNSQTPRLRLLADHRLLASEAVEVMAKKNRDYAKEQDPFANFRTFGGLGILVRLSDKLARLRQFEERGSFAVSDESLKDTVIDGINYLILYYAYKQQESKRDNRLDDPRSSPSGAVAQEVPTNRGAVGHS